MIKTYDEDFNPDGDERSEWDLGLTDLTNTVKRLKVSKSRKGRTEFVEMMKTILLDTESKGGFSIRRTLGL